MTNSKATGMTPQQQRIETILKMHGVQSYNLSWLNGPRPKAKIDAIIADVKAFNFNTELPMSVSTVAPPTAAPLFRPRGPGRWKNRGIVQEGGSKC